MDPSGDRNREEGGSIIFEDQGGSIISNAPSLTATTSQEVALVKDVKQTAVVVRKARKRSSTNRQRITTEILGPVVVDDEDGAILETSTPAQVSSATDFPVEVMLSNSTTPTNKSEKKKATPVERQESSVASDPTTGEESHKVVHVSEIRDFAIIEALKESDEENGRTKEKSESNTESPTAKIPFRILPIIVLAQFSGTSLWFATNSITTELDLREKDIGWSTSAVQFGFILGTLVVATTNLADFCPPSLLFCLACLAGAGLNTILSFYHAFLPLMILRVGTGICLAGIYPIGMKIASDWFGAKRIGSALGWLVGALVLGTSFPFLLRQIPQPYQWLLWETSGIAALGGIAMYFGVPEGPMRAPAAQMGDPRLVVRLFQKYPRFREAAFGYFSHMWELYAFYTWAPTVWAAYLESRGLGREGDVFWNATTVTFYVIAMGSVGCVLGGYISLRYGNAAVAYGSLAISGSLCLLSPLCFLLPPVVTLIVYLIWGATVVADSPQFSSLVAKSAPVESKGTALTAVNCLGFSLTVGSIQLLGVPLHERYLFLLLAPGPMLGLFNRWWQHRREGRLRAAIETEDEWEDSDVTTVRFI